MQVHGLGYLPKPGASMLQEAVKSSLSGLAAICQQAKYSPSLAWMEYVATSTTFQAVAQPHAP